jgi:D-arginine dehydrogenase
MTRYDVAIVGAGIAGASLAAELAPHASVLLLEAEELPGYHATGRSAAFWSETYGGPGIQPLTTASRDWLAARDLLRPRGALYLGRAEDAAARDAFVADFAGSGVALELVDRAALDARVPRLGAEWRFGVWEPSCCDIDSAGAHQAYLADARRLGVAVACRAALVSARRAAHGWTLRTADATYEAALLVNAAGAWADEIARRAGVRPIGVAPYRRTVVQLVVDPPAEADLPLVLDLTGSFYFKPESGRIWLSPHDETPDIARDVAAEELDVAVAIDRFARATGWPILRVERRWAGLRSFAPDRLPVYGFDPRQPDFFWCAGQGGFGIQTAPAAARLAAGLLLGRPATDIDPAPYLPDRFAR